MHNIAYRRVPVGGTRRSPLLAVRWKNDPYFAPAGTEAFRRDIPDADVRLFETGHFALETHCEEIAAAIRAFLPMHSPKSQ
jgi:pimeloyl-ACP methyl ester carboxylesterase